jgi:hypothetical protein
MSERISPLLISSFAASWAVAALLGCSLDSRSTKEVMPENPETADGMGGSAGADPAQSGAPGLGGGGTSAASAGAGSVAPGAAGSSGGGATAVRPADCKDAQLLPDSITEDRTIGPGGVRIQRTSVSSGATLTIQPGTTVLMGAAGLLNVTPLSDVGSHLVAVGTEEQPIVFTSASDDPLPGDWQCVRIGVNGSNSQLEHVIFEYGGQPCAATGAGSPTTLEIEAPLRGIRNVTVRDSLNYGMMLFSSAAVRAFSDNHFARNGQASILIDAHQIFQLGTGNVFEDADDHIDVREGSGIASNGTWLKQGAPFRVQNMGVTPGYNVTIAAGVRFEMSGTIDAFNANFNIEGTEADPVVFTSAQKEPKPGDWGCLLYSYSDVTPRIDHAIFEYAGSGKGCLGSSTKAALMAPNSSNITNTIFRYIDGVAISTRGDCNVSDWCANEFTEVASGPFECEGTLTPCPAQ